MPPAQREFHVFVFSYNRGRLLKECLNSVRKNLPDLNVTVYDDDSDDSETRAVLSDWSREVEVISASSQSPDGHTGGLYSNMNRALEQTRAADERYALLIQDDMQVVRPFKRGEEYSVDSFFAANPNSVELCVQFSPSNFAPTDTEWVPEPSGVALMPVIPKLSDAYADTGIFLVERFFQRWGRFEGSERENAATAWEAGLVRGTYRYPLTMFMPYPITHRLKRRSPRLRMAEYLAGSGVHPFETMPPGEVEKLFAAQSLHPPRAREWLSCPSVEDLRYWSYYGGLRDLRACAGWRGRLAIWAGASRPVG